MCPAGYKLQDVSNQMDITVFECKCQQHVPQIVLCENDQKTIAIKVHIIIHLKSKYRFTILFSER